MSSGKKYIWVIDMMRLKHSLYSEKGSLTVESCISFTFFLSFFILLLFFIRTVSINLVLDHAVAETTKRIAVMAYPVSFAGAAEDMPATQLNKLRDSIGERVIKSQLDEYLTEHMVNKEKVKIRYFYFPMEDEEPDTREQDGIRQQAGLKYGVDFTAEDVVLQIEYESGIKVPFFDFSGIVMVHTAVERAWLHGSNGVVTSRDEGLDLLDGPTVYVTRYGIRYHLGNCRYLRKSKIPMELNQAKLQGYTPCKVCMPVQ